MNLLFMMLFESPRQFVGDFLFKDTGVFIHIVGGGNSQKLDVRLPFAAYGCGIATPLSKDKVYEYIDEVVNKLKDERIIKKLEYEKTKISFL